jgi:hypothetical protein
VVDRELVEVRWGLTVVMVMAMGATGLLAMVDEVVFNGKQWVCYGLA